MFFLTPKYLKQGRLYVKEAEKRLAYNRDRWSAETIEQFEAAKGRLKAGVDERNEKKIEAAADELEKLCSVHCPVGKDAWIGENVEVFLVAIVVALAIRTFFIQPFTIPTASMQPTLFGITTRATTEPPPNILSQVLEFAWAGRTYHNVVAKADETITDIKEVKSMVVRTFTRIETNAGNTYWVNEMVDPVMRGWGVSVGSSYKAGDIIVRGFSDTGDHVFVDKISYHFRKPRGGEVFVFDTRTLETAGRGKPVPSTQYYIKRLAAVGPAEVRVDKPFLYIDGQKASGFGYERVMKGTRENPVEGYRGYSFMEDLNSPTARVLVGPHHYFAMGDNSYNSSDSRVWGAVPEGNLMGAGVFVYWPFGRASQPAWPENRERPEQIPGGRWGFIK